MESEKKTILITGATGYIGSRLLDELRGSGHQLKIFARSPEKIDNPEGIEIVKGDLANISEINSAMNEVDIAYYLVHSLDIGSGDFEEREMLLADNFKVAADKNNVERVIYLGGLAHGDELSEHLRSRVKTGEKLREAKANVIEFRASIIIGKGSASYEMIKALVTRLPVMITPRWVSTCAQPIYIRDVIRYLMEAIEINLDEDRIYEIGGSDKISYLGMMKKFAQINGLYRFMIPVPFLSPGISKLWLSLVTPLQAKVGMKLIEGVKNDSTVKDLSAFEDFDISPSGYENAIKKCMD